MVSVRIWGRGKGAIFFKKKAEKKTPNKIVASWGRVQPAVKVQQLSGASRGDAILLFVFLDKGFLATGEKEMAEGDQTWCWRTNGRTPGV